MGERERECVEQLKIRFFQQFSGKKIIFFVFLPSIIVSHILYNFVPTSSFRLAKFGEMCGLRVGVMIGLAVLCMGQEREQTVYDAQIAGPTISSSGPQSEDSTFQSLNKVGDPLKEGDPLQDTAFQKAYIHPDGTINERVLRMLQKYVPLSAGAVNEYFGYIIFFIIVFGILYSWMQNQKCWEQRYMCF